MTVAAAYRPAARPYATERTTKSASRLLALPSDPPRPEVLKAMRALREMPPFAREREIDFGRYRHFSAKERELLRNMNP